MLRALYASASRFIAGQRPRLWRALSLAALVAAATTYLALSKLPSLADGLALAVWLVIGIAVLRLPLPGRVKLAARGVHLLALPLLAFVLAWFHLGEGGLRCTRGSVPHGRAFPRGVTAWCEVVQPGGQAQQTGLFKQWYGDGGLRSKMSYRLGQLQGPWIAWHSNGRLQHVGRHDRGQRVGVWTWWYADGKTKTVGGYLRGKPHGIWKNWDETGQLVSAEKR